ncbi:hypothetical protein NM688_g2934 [Phlebia brevispora]|uniref:Uncharacterized protein n=1 Tax=Phlebia brevispora TaxID=194682 RepID=A0ACC1T7K2_9APHY|nr:hypothetical protein NM688_g2934 [Phlebia brevispora]
MSYATASQGFSLFPASPTSPHAFSIFSMSQSPRETHALFEDLISLFRPTAIPESSRVLQPSNGPEKTLKRSRSTPSLKRSWRKLLGLQTPEPVFDFVTPQTRPDSPTDGEDPVSPEGSIADEDFGILNGSSAVDTSCKDDDGSSSDGTLVDEELGILPKELPPLPLFAQSCP